MTELVVALVCSLLGDEARNESVMRHWIAPRRPIPRAVAQKAPPAASRVSVSPAVRAAQARAQARTRAVIGAVAVSAHARRSARARSAVADAVVAMRRASASPPVERGTLALCADVFEDLLITRPRFTLEVAPELRVHVWGATGRFVITEGSLRVDELRMVHTLAARVSEWGCELQSQISANERVNDALDAALVRREALLASVCRAVLAGTVGDTGMRAVARRVLSAALHATAARDAVFRGGYASACVGCAALL